jgi:hypothetical protein
MTLRRGVLLIAVATVVLGLVAVLEDQLGPIDPTAPGWRAVVVNDTNRPIHVRSDSYNPLLLPGRSDMFHTGAGQLDLLLTISDEQGQSLGCLLVRLDKRKDITVNASSMRHC